MSEKVTQNLDICEKLGQFLEWSHLRVDLQDVAMKSQELYNYILRYCPHNAELTIGIRKLIEAKDCFVRAKLYKEDYEKK